MLVTNNKTGPPMKKAEIEKELALLTAELKEREAALPAHSIRPHQLQAVMDLEEKISSLQQKLAAMDKD